MAGPLSDAVTRTPFQGRKRAIVKTLCYRVLMIAVTIAIAFWITGNASEALSIGVAANALKTGIYYVYERAWDRIAWGVPD